MRLGTTVVAFSVSLFLASATNQSAGALSSDAESLLQNDGSDSDTRVMQAAAARNASSGNKALDESALDAVRRAAPFRSLPENYKDNIDVRIGFDAERTNQP